MSTGIITPIAGDKTGDWLDDLTDPTTGAWPKELAIVRVTKIAVFMVEIIDSIRITYLLTNGTHKTAQHGGPGGKLAWEIPIQANENIVAVYGRRLNGPTKFGNKNIVQISFCIAQKGAGQDGEASCFFKTATASEAKISANTQFEFSWPFVGLASYTFKTSTSPNPMLQGIGCTQVPAKPPPPI